LPGTEPESGQAGRKPVLQSPGEPPPALDPRVISAVLVAIIATLYWVFA
jgi:hypothetical protein